MHHEIPGNRKAFTCRWMGFKNAKGSHYFFIHPFKPGKITVPNHPGDISPIVVKAILKQAGL